MNIRLGNTEDFISDMQKLDRNKHKITTKKKSLYHKARN